MSTIHALELPEIAALVAAHLDTRDHLACSSVSKALRSSFGPLAWQALSFGQLNPPAPPPRPDDIRAIRDPLDMSILDTDCIMITTQEDHELSNDLCNITPWIRSLFIHDHTTISPLTLGASCNHLETIHLPALSVHEPRHTAAHWTLCKKMMRRNRPHLKSLLLTGWGYRLADMRKPIPGQPVWNPILMCTHAWNMQSLTLVNCRIRGRHMQAFWTICKRLETLGLDFVYLLFTRPREEEELSQAMQSLSCQDSSSTELVSFPKMKELRLRNVQYVHAPYLLRNIIRHCPALQSLSWQHWDRNNIIDPFRKLMEEGTWPELDSIFIVSRMVDMTYQEHERFLQSTRRPLRQLSLYSMITRAITFELYRPHFETLEKLDLTRYDGATSAVAIQVLSSCPNLKSLMAKDLNAQDILKEGNRPWVCRGLEELTIFIHMGFGRHGLYRRLTDEELDQSRAIFKRLATFKQLRSLDMLSYPISRMLRLPYHHPDNGEWLSITPFHFRLQAGLDELAGLNQLVDVRFWAGSHAIFKKEIVWMVDHWKRLRNMGAGQTTIVEQHVTPGEASWRIGITPLLHERGISTHGSCTRGHVEWETVCDSLEDCCGESN
ncbi:hypothetical protein B0O80DRAFT_474686 [Mortierella sp. GBAus27b]|nr:hypothetical protein B0O80DRAFT_474686 [Mortierella sp. GBAus27b]